MAACKLCNAKPCECVCAICGSRYGLEKAHVRAGSKSSGLAKKGYLNLIPLCHPHHTMLDNHIITKGNEPSYIGIDLPNQQFVIQQDGQITKEPFFTQLLLHQDHVDFHNENTTVKIQWNL